MGLDVYGLIASLGATGLLLATVTQSLAGAGQYQLSHAVGLGDVTERRRVFSSLLPMQLLMATALLVVGALLYPAVFAVLTIPQEYMEQARWVYALNLITSAFTIATVGFQGMLLAHQQFLWVAAADTASRVFTLIGVLLLFLAPADRLIYFAWVSLIVAILQHSSLILVCLRRFPEARPSLKYFDFGLSKQMIQYASWSVLGAVSWRARVQGGLLLLNVFFNNLVAGAFSASVQLMGYQNRIGSAVGQPMQPAMTSRFAAKGAKDSELGEMTLSQCKLTGLVTLLLCVPFIVESSTIIRLWLDETRPLAATFLTISSLSCLCIAISDGYTAALRAMAKLKWITLIPILANAAALLVNWAAFATTDLGPELIVYIGLAVSLIVSDVWRPWYAGRIISVPYWRWAVQVGLPIVCLLLVEVGMLLLFRMWIEDDLLRLALGLTVGTLVTGAAGWKFLLNRRERNVIREVTDRVRAKIGRLHAAK